MDCKYTFDIPSGGVGCKAYYESERKDGLLWVHFPFCSEENCPLAHPELLEDAILIEKKGR